MYKNQAEVAHSPKPELTASRSEWDDAGVYGDAHAHAGHRQQYQGGEHLARMLAYEDFVA